MTTQPAFVWSGDSARHLDRQGAEEPRRKKERTKTAVQACEQNTYYTETGMEHLKHSFWRTIMHRAYERRMPR